MQLARPGAGAFLDWIGMLLICFPLFLPISRISASTPYGSSSMAVNLQGLLRDAASYALFYIKGVDPDNIDIKEVYRELFPSCC